jgi:hypothetical protein
MGLEQFKGSSGWLFRFHRRHNTSSKKLCGEISSKRTQQKINNFFKPMNGSNQHEPGPSCSKN